jgi:hypothetical protein
MITPKDVELINFVLAESKNGHLKWQTTAEQGQFTASLRGKYSILLSKLGYARLTLFDSNAQELTEITGLDSGLIEELYEFVRRKTLDVDRAIDEILRPEPGQ